MAGKGNPSSVKNNLQIVVSLLNTQAAHLQEGDGLMAIQESRRRIQVISLLHQKLYMAETSSLIDMQVYIREVVSYLKKVLPVSIICILASKLMQ